MKKVSKNSTRRHGGIKNTEEERVRGERGFTLRNEDWEVRKLGEVCDLITKGTTPTSIGYSFVDSGINFIKIESLDESGKIILNKVAFINEKCNEALKRSQLKPNDILFSIAGALGRVGIVDEKIIPANTNQALAIIRLPEKSHLLVSFLAWFLKSNAISDEIEKLRGGVAQQNLSLRQLNDLKIPMPPLSEQKRIVAILDECFSAIDKAKTNAELNLKNAKKLFESYLQGVFENGNNWETKRLNDVALVFGRGKSKHRPRNWEGLYNGDYPFIQTGDVRNASKYVTEFSQTYNEVGLAQSKLWKKGTICITIAANIAETAILGFDACIPDSIIGFEVDPQKTDLEFTYYLLQQFKTELQKLGKGSAQDNINLGTFENQFFPFPPLKVQKNIVRQLDGLRAETQKLEAVYNKKIADLEELKKSILQKAFAGELL